MAAETPFNLDPREASSRDEPAEIIQQMQDLRQEIDGSIARLHELGTLLRTKAMRTRTEESPSQIVFANAHLRLAGALNQGLRRAASMDRVLIVARLEREEEERRREQEEQRAVQRKRQQQVAQLQNPTDSDFDDLYGELYGEEVTYAE